jgi:hypothetical protein
MKLSNNSGYILKDITFAVAASGFGTQPMMEVGAEFECRLQIPV